VVEPKKKIFHNFQRLVPYFTEMHISRIFKPSSGFKMAHFEAYFHAMAGGTSNKYVVNMKTMTRTLQPEANGQFGREKFYETSLIFRPMVLYMVGKLGT